MSMFRRANATYEAKNSAAGAGSTSNSNSNSNSKASLAKQLFPSSSPTPTNIRDQLQKRAGPSFGLLRSSQPSDSVPPPLRSRSPNPSQPPRHLHSVNNRPAGGKPLAALYSNNDNAFRSEPEPDIIDLTADEARNTKPAVFSANGFDVYEDDFSDDENLDLDYQCPTTLPGPLPRATPAKTGTSLPVDNISEASWSQSSPSHYQAAQPISQSTDSQTSAKRSAPEDDVPAAQPVAKKRTLPGPYHDYRKAQEESVSTSAAHAAPAANTMPTQARLIHTMTPGAVKVQQKKLKEKTKKAVSNGPEASAEEMQRAVTSHTVKQSAISLSKEQELVKELVCDKGKSIFFTGPAGTGKSVLMRAIIAQLKRKYARDSERLAVTASTGLAACNIGGMTLHSFSGIGLGKDDVATLVRKIRRNPKAKNRWLRTKVLVIDEISMVDGDLFDKLSQIGRTIRNNGRPWGGIQLVITGDFFQLPPVPDHSSRDVKFAFEAATWNTSIDHTIGLTEVFRQKDPVFAQMLNEMRLGRISDESVQAFKSLCRPLQFKDGLEVTELFPTRNEVENSNQRRLRELPGEVHRYDALDTGDPAIRDKLLGNMMAPKVIELKKGAQVMLIKNLDDTLVNGSLGTVIGFSTESAFEFSGGIEDEDQHGDDEMNARIKKRFAAFSREMDKSAGPDKKKWPIVAFHGVDGSSRIMLCISEPWKVETPTGEVQASREQLPLILAWALSIHKAQGQTLERVKVDLGKVFEKGQAYVALSRATTQQGLQVLRFDKQKVMAHPRVVSFYQKLYSAESAAKPKKKVVNASIASFANTAVSRPPARKPSLMDDLDDEEGAMASYASAY